MKLLYVSNWYEPAWQAGGPPRSASALCRALVAEGIEVTVLTTDNNQSERLPMRTGVTHSVGGARVVYFHAHGGPRILFSGALIPALARVIRTVDLVHIDSWWQYPAVAAAAVCRAGGVPYVVSPRGCLIEGALRQGTQWAKCVHRRSAAPLILGGARAVHLTSQVERQDSLGRLAGHASFVVPNPIDLTDLKPDRTRAGVRTEFGIPDDAFTLVYSGRLHSSKALPVLLSAVAKARAIVPHLHLMLAGADSDQGPQLRRMATEMGLASAVHFTGLLSRPRLASALCASDAVALTPYPGENFGNACVEAMGMGLPAILSDNVGAAEGAAQDGAALVTQVDADAIAGAIAQLAGDPQRRHRMSQAAAASVRDRYSPQAVAARMIEQYEAVLSGNK